jgi:hypothetical protein
MVIAYSKLNMGMHPTALTVKEEYLRGYVHVAGVAGSVPRD